MSQPNKRTNLSMLYLFAFATMYCKILKLKKEASSNYFSFRFEFAKSNNTPGHSSWIHTRMQIRFYAYNQMLCKKKHFTELLSHKFIRGCRSWIRDTQKSSAWKVGYFHDQEPHGKIKKCGENHTNEELL